MQRVRELPSNAHSSLSEGIRTKRKCTWCEQCFTHCTAHWISKNPHLGETLERVEKASNRTDFLTHQSHIGENLGIWNVAKALDGESSRVCNNTNNLRRDFMKSEKSYQWSTALVYQGTQMSEKPHKYVVWKKVFLETSTFGPQRTYSAENFALVRDLVVDPVHIIDMRITMLIDSWPRGWRWL